MRFGKYEFQCKLVSPAILPYFKGSTFRGVFGHALKDVVCVLKRQTCESCVLKQNCIYAKVFETLAPVKSNDSHLTVPPHPFVIEPPLTTETQFPKGMPFDFNLLLFGSINNELPYFIYAFEQVGKIGIGKKINGLRGNFVLESICLNRDIIYSTKEQKLNMPQNQQYLLIEDSEKLDDSNISLALTFETPLRLKFGNRLTYELPFHVLIRAMLRRASTLLSFYGNGEPAFDYRGMIQRAEKVNIADNQMRWFDWRRYSQRQDKEMLMGGIIGSITYEGNIHEFINLIDFCEQVHIGKQTAFGLGKFKIEKLIRH